MTILFHALLLIAFSTIWAAEKAENIVLAEKKEHAEDDDKGKALKYLKYQARLAFKEAIEAARGFRTAYGADVTIGNKRSKGERRLLSVYASRYTTHKQHYIALYDKLQALGTAENFECPDVLGKISLMQYGPYVKPIYLPYGTPFHRPCTYDKEPQDPSAE
jgi:hypothetical protein